VVRIPSVTRRNDREVADLEHEHEIDDERDLTRGRAHVVERPADAPVDTPAVVEAPVRARASGLATLGLILGVLSAAAVATGLLALPGVAVGLLGVLVAVGGLAATARPHVAGRFDAMLGLLLSLAAVIVGLLALGNAISWPETETNQVAAFADWLKAEFPWLDRM
jgi:hypothetical protein